MQLFNTVGECRTQPVVRTVSRHRRHRVTVQTATMENLWEDGGKLIHSNNIAEKGEKRYTSLIVPTHL